MTLVVAGHFCVFCITVDLVVESLLISDHLYYSANSILLDTVGLFVAA